MLQVSTVGLQIYQVVDGELEFVVDLSRQSCSCRKWDLDDMPCSHACAVIRKANLSHYNYVCHYYLKSAFSGAYGEMIQPVGSQVHWDVPNSISEIKILPPEQKPVPGRPKKKRLPSAGEHKRLVQCGRCKSYGHNQKTCKNLVPIEV